MRDLQGSPPSPTPLPSPPGQQQMGVDLLDDLQRSIPTPRPPGADLNPAINADLARFGRRGINWWNNFISGYAEPPPGFRDMPRIDGPATPQSTPYPRPPFLNFRNWMETGERGPLPLDSRRPGYYPEPYYTPMPQVYDTRTSGGALASGGAVSNKLRSLWDQAPPLMPMRAEFLQPNFAVNLPDVA